MPMLSAPPRTGVPTPTPGLDEVPAAVVDDDVAGRRAAGQRAAGRPGQHDEPPAAAPLAMKVRRLISFFSVTRTPPVRHTGHQSATSFRSPGPRHPSRRTAELLALTLPQAESTVGAQ